MSSAPGTAAARLRRMGIALVVVAVAAFALLLGVRAAWHALIGPPGPQCSFTGFDTTTDQASIASRMVAVVTRRKLPERAGVLVLAAALQESKLRNIAPGQGDRDSVGVLQQRPSQGWGKASDLSDPGYATGAFLDRLLENKRWRTADFASVIQKVQVSADGSLYAQHEPQAQAMADALTGRTPRGLSCRFAAPKLVADPNTVASLARSDLPISTPAVDGPRITVAGASWATAAWFVANADRLGIEEVDCAGAQWRRSKPWRAYPRAPTGAVVAILHG